MPHLKFFTGKMFVSADESAITQTDWCGQTYGRICGVKSEAEMVIHAGNYQRTTICEAL